MINDLLKRRENILKSITKSNKYEDEGKKFINELNLVFSSPQGINVLKYIGNLCLIHNTHLLTDEQKKDALVLRSFYDKLTSYIHNEILIKAEYESRNKSN